MENGNTADLEHFRSRRSASRGFRGDIPSPAHSAAGVFMRSGLQRLKVAKKVRFYRNGDRFYKGMVYAISPERFRSFESLLVDLTRSLSEDSTSLPQGVRAIFSLDGSRKITGIDQLEEGESYVCASTEVFKKLDYARNTSHNWAVGSAIAKNKQKQLYADATDSAEGGSSSTPHPAKGDDDTRDYIRPKLITVIKNGPRPRKAVRILLNKKTAHSYEQVLTDITNAIKMDSGVVRTVRTNDGRQVSALQDFFKDDDIFIAYGAEKYSHDDFDLSEELRMVTPYRASSSLKKERVTLKSPATPRKRMSKTNGETIHGSPGSPRKMTAGRAIPVSIRSPLMPRKAEPIKLNEENNGNQNGQNSVGSAKNKVVGGIPAFISSRYKIGKVIGNGNFAVVKECSDRYTKKDYALKIINKEKCKGKEHMIENEVAILRQLKHPNIILLVQDINTQNDLYLVMELVKGGDLFDAIQSSTKYTERDASGMIYNLASALKYLHAMNIVHRDIKPENLLVCEHVDGSKSLKLGDFGLSVVLTDPLYTVCGTPTYIAPEILLETGYDLKIDIWSAGVITYILLCGFPPFRSENSDQDELFDKILAGSFEFVSPYWDLISNSAKELISCMLEVDANKRYSASDILSHPWVSDSETALDKDLQMSISSRLSVHFDRYDNKISQSAGIALVTSTALDKSERYFQSKRQSEALKATEQEFSF